MLVYTAQCSLDGFTEDASGSFAFTAPTGEVHAFINERELRIGTYVFGRRMFETMRVWDGDEVLDLFEGEAREVMRDFASHYRSVDKVVVSRTLSAVDAPRTSLWNALDLDAIAALVASSERDVAIGGPELASYALRAGVVEELNLLMGPVVVGAGKRALPSDVRLELELRDERSFSNGMVALRYKLLPHPTT